MNKKIGKILVILLLATIVFCGKVVMADEEQPAQESGVAEITTEEVKQETEAIKSERIKAKIIEAGKTYQRDNGNGGTETVQDVKVKILNGAKKDEKFEATYILTYDIDNKIVGYKLREGNTVYVELSEQNGETVVTIQDVVRQNYLIGLVIFFFASIVLVGRKKGVKAIIGLIITLLAIFFILLTTIFKGYNPILVSVGTCFLITILTFAVIGGWNKKSISAALGTIGGVVLAGIIATVVGYLALLSGAGKEER